MGESVAAWRYCPKCDEQKPPTAFYTSAKRGRWCRSCYLAACHERNTEQREWVTAYKLAHGCTDCGYRAHSVALDFDHLPGFERYGSTRISLMVRNAWPLEVIQAEIAKCEVVCSNCHRVRTSLRPQVSLGWDLRRRNIETDDDDYDNPYEQLRLLRP